MRTTSKTLCAALIFNAAHLFAQSATVDAFAAKQKVFRDRGAKALQAEAAREAKGDCGSASSTAELNGCFTQEMKTTDANYRDYVMSVGGLLRLGWIGADAKGLADSADAAHKFDLAEAAWLTYRKAQCDAIYQENIGGTIRGVAFGTCMQNLTRRHLHELVSLYADLPH